jgi:hypothetical protein
MALQAILRLTEPCKTILATKTAKKFTTESNRLYFITGTLIEKIMATKI